MNSEKVKEIKKALECCTNPVYCEKECPYHIYERHLECINELAKDSLTLINEYEKENGELKQHITEVEKGIINIARERNKKEELASKFIDSYNDSLNKFAERLKGKFEHCVGDIYHADTIDERIDETLKEFFEMSMIGDELLCKLKKCFPKSFINKRNEFICLWEYKKHIVNSYFRLDNVSNELELKCKVLEYFSRPSFKGFTYADQPLKERKIGEEVYKYHLDGINKFLGTCFTTKDIEEIYCRLGNGVNRRLCIKFVESDYDLRVLKEIQNER